MNESDFGFRHRQELVNQAYEQGFRRMTDRAVSDDATSLAMPLPEWLVSGATPEITNEVIING